MRLILAILCFVFPSSAWAHWGHLTDVAGHGHWIGLAALGAAIGIAIWLGSDDEVDEEAEEELPDTPAEA